MSACLLRLNIVFLLTLGSIICLAQKAGYKKKPRYPKMFLMEFYDDSDSVASNLQIGKAKNITLKLDRINETVTFTQENSSYRKQIGRYKYDLPNIGYLQFEDLDGDGDYELLLSTWHNMNGNKFMEVYKYNTVSKNIVHAGSLNTDYKINRANKTIEVSYSGSSWMGEYLQRYKWYGCKLLPEKKIERWYEHVSDDSSVLMMAYYVNPTHDKDSLQLQWKKTLNNNNDNAEKIWDDFYKR
jgi:hypothetical protein